MLFYSFRRVFGAASSEPQNVETESAESAGIPFSFHDLLILYICNFIFVIFVFHHLTNSFCKQHCHQGTLKSRFQSSTFCRFYASSNFDRIVHKNCMQHTLYQQDLTNIDCLAVAFKSKSAVLFQERECD